MTVDVVRAEAMEWGGKTYVEIDFRRGGILFRRWKVNHRKDGNGFWVSSPYYRVDGDYVNLVELEDEPARGEVFRALSEAAKAVFGVPPPRGDDPDSEEDIPF